jgi:hypothetical protein
MENDVPAYSMFLLECSGFFGWLWFLVIRGLFANPLDENGPSSIESQM